ncbi:MAG: cupin domain-containing protein [Candidatus Hermodarchaeia archaeon]|jgi:mannose-6-phosphate isomerase-like protein (cupin superfamily)
MTPIIDIWDQVRQMTQPWAPKEIARVNDQVIRLALFDGEFPMHKHSNADELFYVLKGQITIRIKGKPDISLTEGKMTVIPRGVEHSPKSIEPSYVLMFEPITLNSRGD